MASAYTADRPERRIARYVQDDVQRQAWLDVGGPEPALALGPGSPPRLGLGERPNPAAGQRPARAPRDRVCASRGRAAGRSARPADVRSTIGVPSGRAGYAGDCHHAARIHRSADRLPAGIVPATTSLAGRLVDGRWTATFIAVPESGLTVRLGFESGAIAAQAMAGGAVMLTSRGLPGGSGPLGQPDWLPQGAGDLAGAVDLDCAAEMIDTRAAERRGPRRGGGAPRH